MAIQFNSLIFRSVNFHLVTKLLSFVLKFFYHAEREEVEGPQANGWERDIPLSPLHGISKSSEDQFVVVWNTPLIVFCLLANIGS